MKYNLNHIIYFADNTTIYKGKYFHNEVCIKEIKNINYLSKEEHDKIKNEIDISIKLQHKNILTTYGYSFNHMVIHLIKKRLKYLLYQNI